jgi:NADH dehydrogenase [ubiquinone] 1 alpha subcomplex assembly factor 2
LRQERIKLLAAQADARWASKPSAVDAPDKQQPVHMLESRDQTTGISQPTNTTTTTRAEPPPPVTEDSIQEHAPPTLKKEKPMRTEPKSSPWKPAAAKGNPGDEWQPASWSPAPARKRS